MTFGKRTGVLLAAALLAAATGCSTKADDTGGGGGDVAEGEVKTGEGIQGNEITLGVLTDLTGVFAALGNDITNANTLYWEKQNAGEKVCGKYTVKLDIKDTGYVVATGVSLYAGMKDNVLAMQQTIGSPINTALEESLTSDKMVNLPSAWARNLTNAPGNALVGSTYDVEMVNGLSYALEKGLIKKGDKLGHIYFTGEYGENGLAGSEAFAEKNGMTIVPQEIKATDQDMSAQITNFKRQGVNALVLTVAPGQTASAAGVAAAQGLDVPMIGNNPVFNPGLLKGPSAAVLKKNLVIAAPFGSFDNQEQLLKDYTAKYKNVVPSTGVITGYGMGEIMKQLLEKACEGGDLTREGLLKAKSELTDVDTGGLVVPIDYSVGEGKSPSRQSFILQPADVPGGVKLVTPEPVEAGEEAADLA